MSINLGNLTLDAVRELRGNTAFKAVLDGTRLAAETCIDRALSSPPEQRVDSTAYARGVRDVWVALQAGYDDVKHQQVAKPRTGKGTHDAG